DRGVGARRRKTPLYGDGLALDVAQVAQAFQKGVNDVGAPLTWTGREVANARHARRGLARKQSARARKDSQPGAGYRESSRVAKERPPIRPSHDRVHQPVVSAAASCYSIHWVTCTATSGGKEMPSARAVFRLTTK